MATWLHRAAIWIRLGLVCAVLFGAGAPAPAFAYVEAAVVAAAEARPLAAPAAPTAPRDDERASAETAHEEATVARAHAPAVAPAAGAREARAPGPPRRIFLIHCALLC